MIGPAVTTDLGELLKDIKESKRDIKDVAQNLLVETGEEIAERMRAYVPVRTGRLKASIRLITEPLKVVVGPVDVEYAIYVEYGTGSRGELAMTRTQGGRRLIKVKNQWIPLSKPTGQRAQPYMRPAAADVLSGLGVDFAEAGRRQLAGRNV